MAKKKQGEADRRNNSGNIQIRIFARSISDTHGFISEPYMKAFPVGGGIDSHGLDVHFLAGADDPKGNLSTIGD